MADITVDRNFRDQICAMHQGQSVPNQMTLDVWTYHLLNLVTAFTRFAKQLPLFRSLNQDDQTALVTKNAFLFVQYLLGRYFSAPSGIDQLSWILDSHVPLTNMDDMFQLQVNSLITEKSLEMSKIHPILAFDMLVLCQFSGLILPPDFFV